MRKLRERLNNRKGFTLVELIVVIVIILILAAVLIPNVMRYVGQARESAFQNEASGYLTEISGYAVEHFAKYGKDLGNSSDGIITTSDAGFGSNEVSGNPLNGAGARYALSGYSNKVTSVRVYCKNTKHSDFSGSTPAKSITVTVWKGAVIAFSYTDNTYYVNWTQSGGWGTVTKRAT